MLVGSCEPLNGVVCIGSLSEVGGGMTVSDVLCVVDCGAPTQAAWGCFQQAPCLHVQGSHLPACHGVMPGALVDAAGMSPIEWRYSKSHMCVEAWNPC